MAIKKKKKPEAGKKKTKRPVKSIKKTGAQKKPANKKAKGKAKPAIKTVRKKLETMGSKTKNKPKVKSKIITSVPKKKISLKTAMSVSKRPSGKTPVRVKPSGRISRQETLKRLLIRKREEIVSEAKTEIGKYIKGEANQLVETALDDGDWSVIDLSADINLRLLESHRGSLLKIDESLRKLREGSYGVCEDCGSEISAERLRVMPFAIFCRDCQEKKEELEKVTREEIPG